MTNLLDRVPVPGSFGVQPSTNVSIHIQTTDTIIQSTVTVKLNGQNAIFNGAFQAGYAGTIVTDGSGGWNVTINPSTNFQYNTTVTVQVLATETTGPTPFNQSYAFQTVRDIKLVSDVTYYEEGDVIEASVWAVEGQTPRPETINTLTFALRRSGTTISNIVYDNVPHDGHAADGTFNIRLLHPVQIGRDLTYEVQASVDGYQAPGLNTLTTSGTIKWEARQTTVLHQQSQPDLRIGAVIPQTTPSEYGTTAIQQDKQAEYEAVDLRRSGDELVEPSTLVDLDFLNGTQYLQELTGDLSYVGGGNRLLNGIDDTADWFLQEADELPVTFGARSLVEGPATNLLAHSTFDENQFVLTVPDTTVRSEIEVSELTSGVNQVLYVIEGSVIFDGTSRNITIGSPKVSITSGQPVLCSVLARTLLRDDTVTLDTFAMRVKFFNVSNVQVGSTDFNFDIFAFQSETTFSLMEALIPVPSIPPTATQVSFDIVIGSWEGCDLMNLWLAAPMIEHALFATSRVVGNTAGVARILDNFRIQQAGNLNQRSGRIATTYAPQYEVSPPVNVTLFDTRDVATFRSGYTLRHRTDGKFELTAVDSAGTTTTVVTAAAVPLTFGQPVEMIAQWTKTSLRIMNAQQVIAEQLGAYAQPAVIQQQISIGQKIDGTEPLYGELHRFVSYGIA
jgi:hypothetical protein